MGYRPIDCVYLERDCCTNKLRKKFRFFQNSVCCIILDPLCDCEYMRNKKSKMPPVSPPKEKKAVSLGEAVYQLLDKYEHMISSFRIVDSGDEINLEIKVKKGVSDEQETITRKI